MELKKVLSEVYMALFEFSRDAVIITTVDGNILAANPAACALFSSSVEELFQLNFSKLTVLQDSEFETILKDHARRHPFEVKLSFIRRDGARFSGHIASLVHQSETGDECQVIFIRDGDESAHLQADLRESEERLHQIVSALRVAIWIRDARTRKILYVNPAFEEIFGVSRQTFYDNPDTVINAIHPDDCGVYKKGMVGFSIEHRIIRPDGGIRWVWGRNFPVKNEAGEVYRLANILEDITERKQVEEELRIAYDQLQKQVEEIQSLHTILRDQAIRDPLTKLHNRRYLDDSLEQELARAKREGYPVSLLMIDIDNFKVVNDVYGHQYGDLVLQKLANIIKDLTRASDITCRFGGDEFVLVLPTSPAKPAYRLSEEILSTFLGAILENARNEIKVTLSIGISVFPIHGNTRLELLKAADDAMYEAKKRGKNRIVLWQE